MTTPHESSTEPADGVAAMLSILSALAGRHPVSYQEMAALTGLASCRLWGYAGILQEDGLIICERQAALRLTNSGEAILRQFGPGKSLTTAHSDSDRGGCNLLCARRRGATQTDCSTDGEDGPR